MVTFPSPESLVLSCCVVFFRVFLLGSFCLNLAWLLLHVLQNLPLWQFLCPWN